MKFFNKEIIEIKNRKNPHETVEDHKLLEEGEKIKGAYYIENPKLFFLKNMQNSK